MIIFRVGDRPPTYYRWQPLLLAPLLLVVLIWPPTIPRAGAVPLQVTTTADSGVGSLRDTIVSAAPGDTITFSSTLIGQTITLTSGHLVIDKDLTVTGLGAALLTVSGNRTSRIFDIASGATVTIAHLSVVNGKPQSSDPFLDPPTGGGIRNAGTLTIANCIIANNEASYGGGIDSNINSTGGNRSSALTLTNTTVRDNKAGTSGGGLSSVASSYDGGRSTATVQIANSTFSGNSAQYAFGGAILGGTATGTSGMNLTVTNSTFAGNNAAKGGGIYFLGYATATAATLTNLTLKANYSTQSGDGGGLHIEAGAPVVNVRNTILAQNANRNIVASPGSVVSQGYNISDDASGASFLTSLGDLNDSDPKLIGTTPQENGGPTRTFLLSADSPALNHVPTAGANCPATDQRGVARPSGSKCESGAVELAPSVLTLTKSGSGTVTVQPNGTQTGPNTRQYPGGTAITLTVEPNAGYTFVGWRVDGALRGWASPLQITLGVDRSVVAVFASTASFSDIDDGGGYVHAIRELASRGYIRGYTPSACAARGIDNPCFGPTDRVSRAEMAALIARATPSDLPPGNTIVPPACFVANSWDCEDWGNDFTDRQGLDGNLWRNIGTLQHYNVANGYDNSVFGPYDRVSYAQTIAFITRAMVAKNYWQYRTYEAHPYEGVPATHETEVRTFYHYTRELGGILASPENWNDKATRGWFARQLWQALNSYWRQDNVP
jgi:hypothetical protein